MLKQFKVLKFNSWEVKKAEKGGSRTMHLRFRVKKMCEKNWNSKQNLLNVPEFQCGLLKQGIERGGWVKRLTIMSLN